MSRHDSPEQAGVRRPTQPGPANVALGAPQGVRLGRIEARSGVSGRKVQTSGQSGRRSRAATGRLGLCSRVGPLRNGDLKQQADVL